MHPSRHIPAFVQRAAAAAAAGAKPKRVRKPKAQGVARKALVDRIKDGDRS